MSNVTTDQKLYRERLLNVAKALRESPNPEKFNMEYYVHKCGTPSCALGHYAARRDLQDAFIIKGAVTSVFHGEELITDYSHIEAITRPGESLFYDFQEVKDHFGLSFEELEKIFEFDGCGFASTPIAAAEFIEHFVSERFP